MTAQPQPPSPLRRPRVRPQSRHRHAIDQRVLRPMKKGSHMVNERAPFLTITISRDPLLVLRLLHDLGGRISAVRLAGIVKSRFSRPAKF